MTKTETAKVLTYLMADFDHQLSEAKVNVWHDQLKHLSYEVAFTAARVLMGRKTYGAPKVADMIDAVKEITRPERNETWSEAWDKWVRLARSHGYYRRGEAIEKYKAECPKGRKALGTMAQEFFDIKSEELPTYRAQFRQRFEAIEAVEERQATLPPHVHDAVKALAGSLDMNRKLIGGGNG